MKLYIFTTEKDYSAASLVSAAEKFSLKPIIIHYHLLSYREGKVWYGDKPLSLTSVDKICIRWPGDIKKMNKLYTFYVNYLIEKHFDQIILDRFCLKNHLPHYEDKLFQSNIFSKLRIRTPRTWHFSEKEMVDTTTMSFPLVFKKRISWRSKHSYLIASKDDVEKKLRGVNVWEYLFQDYIPFAYDLRVLCYKGHFIGAVNRKPHLRRNNRLTVKGGHLSPWHNKRVIDQCLRYMEYIGADLVGFDVLIGKNGKSYLIEANLAPQYEKFEERTGIPVSERIIKDIL